MKNRKPTPYDDEIVSMEEANETVFKIAAADLAKLGLVQDENGADVNLEDSADRIYKGLMTSMETYEPFFLGGNHKMLALFPDTGQFISAGIPQVTLVWFGDHINQPTEQSITFVDEQIKKLTH